VLFSIFFQNVSKIVDEMFQKLYVKGSCEIASCFKNILIVCGGGVTRPLPRDGSVEELHGGPTVGPRPKVWTTGQKRKK